MKDIEREIELETKDYKHLMDTILTKISNNIETGSSEELKCACEMLEKVADAKLDCIKGKYHVVLMEAMTDPENQYGENWDENGRKGYTSNGMPNSNGGGMNNRMGYSMNGNRGYENPNNQNYGDMQMNDTNRNMNSSSRYERARRGYEEVHDMSSLNKIFDVIEEDMKELKPEMSTSDKQTAHQRLMTLANMVNV